MVRALEKLFGNPSLTCESEAVASSEYVVRTIDPGDPRVQQEDFATADEAEVEELKCRNLWRIVKKKDI